MKPREKVEKEILIYVQEDWMPLHAVVRSFLQYDKQIPDREEFLEILDFVASIIDQEYIVCVEGPEMTKVEGTGKEITDRILALYDQEGYESIDYGFWLDQKGNHS